MAHSRRAKVKDPAKAFISTWKTDNLSTGSSTNTQVKLPLVSTGTYKFTVNWGDGSSNVITTWNQAEVTHTYATIGTYTITITGFIKGWEFNNSGDRLKIMTLVQWGCLRLGNDMPFGAIETPAVFNRGFFYGCENITYTTTNDILNLKGVTNTCGLFRRNYQATKINNIEKLDISKVTSALLMIGNCVRFDGDVSYFNTSNLTNMYGMLTGQQGVAPHGNFTNMGNPDIGNWDTSKVTNMTGLFGSQYKFNQNIGNWDLSKVTSIGFMFGINPSPSVSPANIGTFNNGGSDSIKNWDTSKVVVADQVFIRQASFNQPIGSWNMSSALNISYMFYIATNFNQPIGNWNISLATNLNELMVGKTFNDYSAANYDALLIGWASRPVQPNRSIGFGTIKYTAAASAARAILTSAPNNWTIVDGGLQA